VELAHHIDMDLRLDDPALWPSIEEVFGDGDDHHNALAASGVSSVGSGSGSGSSGWEHVALPDGGDNWVLIEEVEKLTLGGGKDEDEEEEEEEEEEGKQGGGGAPTGAGRMSYRTALVSNLMEGDEGATGPSASRRFFPFAAIAARRKRVGCLGAGRFPQRCH
jgi:hypothetical protein